MAERIDDDSSPEQLEEAEQDAADPTHEKKVSEGSDAGALQELENGKRK
jgi:hypothetical protein